MTPIITIPGSKSYTNRALLMAALAPGQSVLKGCLLSDDTKVMIEALETLGVKITTNETTLTIDAPKTLRGPLGPLHLGNAGTAVRFLTAILAHQPFLSVITGDPRMQERPIQDLIDALSELGANITGQNGCPPLTIHGSPLTRSETHITGKNSSQYISALMILAPLLPEGLTIHVEDEATSKPYLDMTLDLMNKFCIQDVEREQFSRFTIPSQKYQPTDLIIEADASSATYFFGLAAITEKTITVANLSRQTLQPDIQILDYLEQMGCQIHEDETGITVTGPEQLKPLGQINANSFPDGAMTLAVVSAFAPGKTTLTGLHNLRIKECDRLEALKTELNRIGITAETTDDSLTIHGNPTSMHGAPIKTYKDHRMAMCFGMAKTRIPDLEILDPDCVSKTYPNFWEDLKKVQ
ncbi:3-phosphoshikimate 1-carboxyvinyltransferase [Candidatus Peregrinibacteria bacterium]|jgi:3-phosphoshikimate 1-carboxyvinyltransferase|nr:3-phosphoshikimate 1-carboxyvinyltransferase [Candidatus Peregrinibacteria bacterium]MBT7483903.1 3-phosphoshikimate 1-carboxyvinyltransferase [Candidatus Peregrinibacteria bacterium]MBT7702859.1 3-phosphoshikimate 1-carboxyvinyltransferase [Candidatus Peregrinibacteria bacterium]